MDKDVACFQVAMDDGAAVDVVYTKEDLCDEVPDCVFREVV